MIAWKLKLWRTVGATAALTLAAACGGEGGEAAKGEGGGEAGEAAISGEAGEAAAPAAGGEAGEAAIGESGGEHGEAGVSDAYAGVTGDQRTALRIEHLRGFVMAAEKMVEDGGGPNGVAEAAVLVQQGLLEVYEPATDQFGSLDVAVLREAAAGGELSRAQMQQRLRASQAALDSALNGLDIDGANLVVRLVDIAAGLYQNVLVDGYVDPIEYKHSMGAALSARHALGVQQQALRDRNLRGYGEAANELNRFIALWPSAEAPETPATYQQVLVQGSRVRLALSPFL
ncbi:MAG: hypothetical protein AB7O98_07845 [Hyphomonadaceae bacterium]